MKNYMEHKNTDTDKYIYIYICIIHIENLLQVGRISDIYFIHFGAGMQKDENKINKKNKGEINV